MKNGKRKSVKAQIVIICAIVCLMGGLYEENFKSGGNRANTPIDSINCSGEQLALNDVLMEPLAINGSPIPEYADNPYIIINGNEPFFSSEEYATESYEYYSNLDEYGRCGSCMACIGTDLMPTEERGEIGMIKPTGWWQNKYDFVDGKYLYNRCHLIGYQLSGENANEKNLITGTRYMNVEGMLPFEEMVADYVRNSGNHVLYRVSPIYEGSNLLASGVEMEAASVEDNGDSVCFNVYVYNVQPGVDIEYATGRNRLAN